MREFIQQIRSVQKIDDLGDLRRAVVETKSRWNPRAQPRVWCIWTDVWEGGVVAHLDAGKTKRPSLAALPWPVDPFIGTRPTTRGEQRKRGTYPQTKKEFVEAIGTFDRAKVDAALWWAQLETYPKGVLKALQDRLGALPEEPASPAKPAKKGKK